MTRPFIFRLLSTRYEKSGITLSIPNMSSSGKDRPQSIIIISFSHSMAVMFFPISPRPPRGMIFTLEALLLLFCFFFLLPAGAFLTVACLVAAAPLALGSAFLVLFAPAVLFLFVPLPRPAASFTGFLLLLPVFLRVLADVLSVFSFINFLSRRRFVTGSV